MRLSTHTRILPIIGPDGTPNGAHVLLVNGLYGAMDVVSAHQARALANNTPCRDQALEARLLRRGHLSDQSPEEEERTLCFLSRLYRLSSQGIISFDIVPAYDCNFRCSYRFESHRLAKGEKWLSCSISPEMLNAFFAAIKQHKSKGGIVELVNLHGGEPLLAKNVDLIREICERCRELQVPIEVVTNGNDLDSYLDMAVEYEWRDVQVTVDGYGELTDRSRRHKCGGPTYERVMSNVVALSSRGIRTGLRINVDRECLGRIHEVIEDIRTRGLEGDGYRFGYYFAPISLPHSPEREVTTKQILDELIDQGISSDDARKSIVSYRVAWDEAIFNMKKRLPLIHPSRCSAIEGRTGMDPYGRVYRCLRSFGYDGEEAGMLRPDGSFAPNANAVLWRMRDAAHLPKCRRCPYVFNCGGGCAAKAFNQTGSWFKPHCDDTFEVLDFTLPRVVGKTWREGHDPELTLSWAEALSRISKASRERFLELAGAKEQVAFASEQGWFELIRSRVARTPER